MLSAHDGGRQHAAPTVVSIYNYMQPVTAVAVSALSGVAVFQPSQGLAMLLVFAGVALVTKSKSKRDMEMTQAAAKENDTRTLNQRAFFVFPMALKGFARH